MSFSKTRIVSMVFQHRALLRDIVLSFGSTIAGMVSGTVVILVLGRLLDVSSFGEVVYAATAGTLVALVPSYGFDLQVVRDIAQKRLSEREALTRIPVAKLVLTMVAILCVAAYMRAVQMPTARRTLVWFFVVSATANSFTTFIGAVRKGVGDFTVDVKSAMARSALLSFLIAAAMLLAPHSAFIIGMIFMGSSILTLGLSIGLVSLRVPVGALPCPRASVVWRTLKDGFPFGLQVILATLYYQVDTMIVAEMLDVGMVGYYQASARLVLAVLPFAMLFINTFYPRLAGSYNSKTGDVECRSATAMMGILTVFGLVGTMVLGLFARFWILTIYGPKMLSSVAVLQILSLVLLIRSVAGGLGIVLIARRRQVVLVWAAGVATVVNVALNVLFIPRAGILACAWVNVFTNCIMLCIYAAALLVVKPATAVQVGHNA